MLKYLIAVIVIAAAWLSWWLVEGLPLWVPISVTVVAVLVVLGVVLYGRYRSAKAARELENALGQQAALQHESARPDMQPELAEVRAEFEKAVSALKGSKLGRGRRDALYILPWYLIIGPPGSGKTTALRNSGLEFPHLSGGNRGVRGIGGTRNCDWWLTNEAVLLDTAGRWSTQEEDRDEWLGFLGMLRKYRKRKPLNGVIVTLSVVELAQASSEELTEIAKRMRERVDEAMAELKMALPIYVLFTKCDLMSGFVEAFGNLSKDERSVVWGFTVPIKEGANPGAQFEEHLGKLVRSLEGFAVGRLDHERQVEKRHKIFGLPQQLDELRRCFGEFINQLFSENIFSDTPMMRGVYFASGTQEGRPFDLTLQRLASAYNLSGFAEKDHEVEPKGYFLRDLFRKVIFLDHDLALRSESERRRQRLAYYAGVVSIFVLSGLLLAIPAVSFVSNRALVRQTEELGQQLAEDVHAAEGAALAPQNYAPVVEALSTLRDYDENSPPIKMRAGLYQGDALAGPLGAFFGRVFESNVVRPAFEEDAARMDDFGREYERRANDIPTSREYVENLDRLRWHLLMTSPKEPDEPTLEAEAADWVASGAVNRWAAILDLSGEDEDALADASASAEAYAMLLAADSGFGFRREAAVVQRARSGLSRVSGIDLVIDGLVSRHQGAGPEITVRRMVGSGVPSLGGRRSVRPAFTKKVWEEHLRDIFSGKGGALVGDMWVLGEYGARVETDATVDEKTYLKQLRSRYFERYIDEWREFIRGLQVSAPGDTNESLDALKDLTRGRPTALGRLFIEINRNIDLRKKPGLLDKAEGAIADAATKVGVDTERDRAYLDQVDLYEAFKDFVSFGVSEEPVEEGSTPQPTGLDVYEEQLLYLRNALQAKLDDPAGSGLSKDLAAARAETKGLIDEQDVGWRPAFESILWPPIEGASMSYSHAAASVAGRAWCNAVYEPFRSAVQGRYPLSTRSEDVPLADFAAFYRPGDGLIWKFHTDFLQGRIPRRGNTFEFATALGMPASQVHTQSVRRFLTSSWAITQSLFPSGSADPRVDFEVRVRPSPRVAEQILSIGGTVIRYYNGPEQWTRLSWPGEAPGRGASIEIRGAGGMREVITREGGWGLFRLIEEGSARRVDSRTFTVLWRLRSHGIDVQIDFRMARRSSPFFTDGNRQVLGVFRGSDTSAPREIVTGRRLCGG